MEKVRVGSLRHIWASDLTLDLKLRLYISGCCSILVYGSESWVLNDEACRCINGANAYMLSHKHHTLQHNCVDSRKEATLGRAYTATPQASQQEDKKRTVTPYSENTKACLRTPASRRHSYGCAVESGHLEKIKVFANGRDDWRKLVNRLKEQAKRTTKSTKKKRRKKIQDIKRSHLHQVQLHRTTAKANRRHHRETETGHQPIHHHKRYEKENGTSNNRGQQHKLLLHSAQPRHEQQQETKTKTQHLQ